MLVRAPRAEERDTDAGQDRDHDVVTLLDREANDQVLALAFANGWTVGELEASSGLAKPRRASCAALLASSMLRRTFGEDKSLTMANMSDAGHFANRTDPDPLPSF